MTRRPVVLLALFLSGCASPQSALHAGGSSALALKDLILFLVLVCLAVWLAVVGFLLWSLTRRRAAALQDAGAERGMRRGVYAALAVTILIVTGLTLASFDATRHLDAGAGPDVVIRVKAQQWWWQFTYPNAQGEPAFQTANELHVPVGRRIRLELEALDVIHSLWIPSLAGKLDMIPGRKNILTLQALRPGIYRGQCAEFCGLQHSHMAFVVLAETEEDYQRWWSAQAAPAIPPRTEEVRAGQAVFMTKPCAACHTIRGTEARGSTGPDLTHIGSRVTVGAGLLERTRGSLAAWIADPQTLKPGNNMPLVPLSSDELRQVSAYLDALK